jgi:hypothetical protein
MINKIGLVFLAFCIYTIAWTCEGSIYNTKEYNELVKGCYKITDVGENRFSRATYCRCLVLALIKMPLELAIEPSKRLDYILDVHLKCTKQYVKKA